MMEMKSCLENLPYWNELTSLEQETVERSALIRRFDPGAMLYGMGENSLGMLQLLSGEIRAYILSEEGREITLYRLLPGDLGVLSSVGVLSHVSFETHLEAVSETEILVIPEAVFSELTEKNIHVRCFSFEIAAQRSSVIMWVLQQILFARFDQRLASFLMEEYRRTGSAEINMTQEQIAGYVNSAREVVARMLKRFASEGWIDNRRGTIELKDIPALEKLGGAIMSMEKLTNRS